VYDGEPDQVKTFAGKTLIDVACLKGGQSMNVAVPFWPIWRVEGGSPTKTASRREPCCAAIRKATDGIRIHRIGLQSNPPTQRQRIHQPGSV